MSMELEQVVDGLRKFNGLKVKYQSFSEIKDLVNEIYNGYMKIDMNEDWIQSGSGSYTETSDINIIMGWVDTLLKFHPKVDEFLNTLAYFQPYSEDMGSNFLLKGKTYDTHNCLLQKKNNNVWYWYSLNESSPNSLRTTVKSKEAINNHALESIFHLHEESYAKLNINFANNLKSIVDNDVSAGWDGYDPSIIKNKTDAHGFSLVGDVHYVSILKPQQNEIRLALSNNFLFGSLRLLNYPEYPGSKKNNEILYSELPSISISIEDLDTEVDNLGAYKAPEVTKVDESAIKVK